MQNLLRTFRSLAISACVVMTLVDPLTSHADPLPVTKAVLNECSGGAPASFTQACDAHPGYIAIHLKLTGDGGCMDMCCAGDADSGYTRVSDANPSAAYRRPGRVRSSP